VDAIRADHEVGGDPVRSGRAVVGDQAVRGDGGDMRAGQHGFVRQRAEQDFVQGGAVHADRGRPGHPFQVARRDTGQPPAVRPAGAAGHLGAALRPHGRAEAERVEAAHAVRLQHQTRSDRPKRRRPVERRHIPARTAQADRRAEAADTGPDHHRQRCHPRSFLQ
jgi:hypothetical protein